MISQKNSPSKPVESNLVFLQKQNESLTEENEVLTNEVDRLNEQVNWFKRQVFGPRSEKTVKNLDNDQTNYLPGFEWLGSKEKKKEEEREVTAHKRKKPKRNGQDKITVPDDLPVERVDLDVSDEEKVCPQTGQPLVKIGEEISSKLARTPGRYFIKQYVRPKYALPNGDGVRTASLPDSIIPRCRADESLLADILTKKFADHLPLNRISEGMARDGILIKRQVLSQWVIKIGEALEPLYNLMHKKILSSGVVFADETPIKLLSPGKGKTHQAYMWVLAGGKERDPPYRIYQFETNRKHKVASDIIGDYRGVLHSDKYGAYETLAAQKQITWCPCWSHVRRKFKEAESGDPQFQKWCLRKIDYLFMLERVAWNRSPEERLKIRQTKEAPIIDELLKAVRDKLVNGKVLPKSKYREALVYCCGLSPYLKNYTKDPWARLDNNVAERAIRPLAVGRKNWLFVGSEKGGKAAAVLLSLVQTCRALGINPREYLEDLLRNIMSCPSNKIIEWLPDHWFKRKNPK